MIKYEEIAQSPYLWVVNIAHSQYLLTVDLDKIQESSVETVHIGHSELHGL